MLGEETSSTPPSQKTSAGGGSCSVLKLLRKRNCAEGVLITMFGVLRYLSLIPSWSGMKASLGAVSGVTTEVTHRVGSPEAFVATQPAGRAGAVTPSKFCANVVLQ